MLAAPGNVGAGVSASLTGPLGNTISGTKFDNRTTVSDVFYQGTLKWNQGVNNEMVYITGNIPSGTYDPGRLANLSFGFVAFDVGGAYTYLNPQTGHEFSVAAGVTYSLPNPDLQTASIFISTGALPNSSPRMFRLAWQAIISSSSRRTAVPARSSAPSRAWRSALVRSSDSCFRSATCRLSQHQGIHGSCRRKPSGRMVRLGDVCAHAEGARTAADGNTDCPQILTTPLSAAEML